MQKDVMIGKHYGKLTVICQVPNLTSKQKYPPRKYRCICECGGSKQVIGRDLIRGRTKSCGCIKGKSSRLTMQQVKEILRKRNLYIYGNDVYTNTKTKMNFIDNKGYKYFTTIDNIKDHRTLNLDIVGKRNPYSIENIQNWLNIQGVRTRIIDNIYIGEKTKMKFECECGNVFEAKWNTMYFYKICRCPRCTHKQSKNEMLTEKYLKLLKIQYKAEKWFIDCRNKLPYKFDFYLPDYNTIIEVHGE